MALEDQDIREDFGVVGFAVRLAGWEGDCAIIQCCLEQLHFRLVDGVELVMNELLAWRLIWPRDLGHILEVFALDRGR